MSIRINGDNTAANPGITGADTDTGLSFGTNEVSINTDGTERFRVGSSGELGIGGATYGTSGQVLTSQGSGSAPQWSTIASDSITEGNTSVEVVDTGSDGHITFDTEGSEAARFDSSGRLLVGTTSQVIAGSKVEIKGNGDGTGTGGKLTIAATNNWQDAGDLVGEINFANNSGGTPAIIRAEGDGFGGSGDYPGRLVFLTTRDSSSTATERMRITSGDANGSLFFFNCTQEPSSTVKGTAIKPNGSNGNFFMNAAGYNGNYTHWQFYNPNGLVGSITTNGSATSYNTSSDYRLKENVVPLTGAADRLNQLQVRRFNFIADPDTTVDGFIAHEAQAVVPECVTGTHNEVEVWKEGEQLPDGVSVGDNKLDENGNTIPVYQGIDQSKLVPLLTAALQEALAKIETLETRLTALEGGAS